MDRVICAFVLSVVSAAALGAETIDLGPSDWRKWDPRTSHHTLEGLRTSYGQPVRMGPSGGSLSVTRNPVVPYGSIGNGLKTIARSTPAAILTSGVVSGLFYGLDWVFENSEWQKMEPVTMPVDPSSYHWTSTRTALAGQVFPSYTEACDAAYNSIPNPYYPKGTHVYPYNGDVRTAQCTYNNTANYGYVQLRGESCPFPYTFDAEAGNCRSSGLVPLSDADFSELTSKLPSLPAITVGGAAGFSQDKLGGPLPGYFDSPITGPESVTGPSTTTTTTGPSGTETAVSTTTTNISYGPTTITTTNTTTTNTYTNGQPSGTTTTTETPSPDLVTEPPPSPGGSTSLDIPTDCEFMPTVCAFLDWFKEPVPMPEPDLPVVVDHDFEREYEMNLTAECPPPYTVDTQLFGTLSISWQPFCDLSTLIKPLVVGSAFLLSAFITLGIGRGKG